MKKPAMSNPLPTRTPLVQRACFAATDGVRWASSHPAQDRILLQGLVFHGYHGVLEEVCMHPQAACHARCCMG